MKVKIDMFKHVTLVAAMVAAIMAVGAVTARAGVITVLNPSFESAGLPLGGWSDTIADWTKGGAGTGGSGAFNPTTAAFDKTDGMLLAPGDGTTYACFYGQWPYIYQDTGVAIAANRTYTLTAALGHRITFDVGAWNMSLRTNGTDTIIAQVLQGGGGAGPEPAAGAWADQTVSFNTLSGNNSALIGKSLSVLLASNGGGQFGWDNVRLSEVVVPEPATLALLGLGGMMVGLRRRNRK